MPVSPERFAQDVDRRMAWCPTGPLTLLPIHAAGDRDTPGAAVLDRVDTAVTMPKVDAHGRFGSVRRRSTAEVAA